MACSGRSMSDQVSWTHDDLAARLMLAGFRVPFYMISPWTRGNRVFTERADHNSHILFVEEWLKARGYQNITTGEMVSWRREHMSNLVSALDFDNVCIA
jgi:phospholipase C